MRALAIAVVVLGASAQAALPGSLSLEEALQLGRERQPALRQMRAQADVSSARARESLSPLLPTVSAAIGYSRATSNVVPRASYAGGCQLNSDCNTGEVCANGVCQGTPTLNTHDYWNASVNAQVTIWDFGQNWNRYQASLSSVDAAAAQVHASEVAEALQVRTSFFTALAQRELVDVAKASLANAEAHLAQVQGFVSVGARPEIDLAQSRADKANARLAVVTASNGYAVARAKLNQAMGLEAPPTYEVVGDVGGVVDVEDSASDALYSEALKARPEVIGLEAQVRSQELILRSTRAAYYPTLGASLGVTLGASSLANPVPNVNGQLTLNWQIYGGGITVAQVSEGEATLRQLAAQRDGLTLQVRLDVDQAELGVHAARESVDVASEALEAAKEQLRLAEGRYKAGAGSALELADAQVRFTTASAQRVSAVYSLATARAQLLAALGRP